MSAGGAGFSPFLQGQRRDILSDLDRAGGVSGRRLQSRIAASSLSAGRPASLVPGDVARGLTQFEQGQAGRRSDLRQTFLNQDIQGLLALGQLAGGTAAFLTGNPLLGASLLGGGAAGFGNVVGQGSGQAGSQAVAGTQAAAQAASPPAASPGPVISNPAVSPQTPPASAATAVPAGPALAMQNLPDNQLEAIASGQIDPIVLLSLLLA